MKSVFEYLFPELRKPVICRLETYIGNKLDWKHKKRLETFVLDWKQKKYIGNNEFRNGNYQSAIKFFDEAIEKAQTLK